MVTQSPSAESEKVTSLGQHRFTIAGDTVRRSIQDLPKDQQEPIIWFHGWCCKFIRGKTGLGQTLKKPSGDFYSVDSIVQLLTGGRIRRGENIDVMLDAIARFRRIEGAREEQAVSGFIETSLFFEMERRCLKALQRQRILFIFGDSQIGKTDSLKEIQRRHNHGQTLYIEIPTFGSYGGTIDAFAEALNIPTASNNQRQIKERIIEAIDGNMLVILDEAHRFLEGRQNTRGLQSLSFVRELWNKKHPGIVMAFTNEGRDKLLHGPHARTLQQIWRRRITPLQLPAVPPDADAALFAHAYGLDPAPEEEVAVRITTLEGREITHRDSPLRLQREVLKTEGLGVWIAILQDACDMAQDAGRKVTWAAVLKAHAQAQAEAEIFQ